MTGYSIIIDKPAMRFLRKQSMQQQQRILRAINGLPENGDVKPLTGHKNIYRLRVGVYRIIYSIENKVLVIRVLDIGNRGDVYKGL